MREILANDREQALFNNLARPAQTISQPGWPRAGARVRAVGRTDGRAQRMKSRRPRAR